MANPGNTLEGFYPIGAVSELTGINSVTLRAWERRYGLLTPQRSDSGHRMYTEDDVSRIKEVLHLMDQGIAIGHMRDALDRRDTGSIVNPYQSSNAWQSYLDEMIEAIRNFDEQRLDKVYNEALSLYPVVMVTQQLLLPLLQELGRRWLQAEGSIAEEHFFSVYLRNKLGARFHHKQQNLNGPTILSSCLPGEYHETGLLLFALAAQDRGYRIILLGANMPLEELPLVINRTRVYAIVLAASISPDVELLDKALPELIQSVNVPVFIGGAMVNQYAEQLTRIGAIPIGDDLVTAVKQIHNHMQQKTRGML